MKRIIYNFMIYLIKISFDLNTITKLQTVKEILYFITLRLLRCLTSVGQLRVSYKTKVSLTDSK